jgi:GxxExxY protein
MEMILKDEVYLVVGCCMEVWKTLGYGFSEVIYKDAMEVEFDNRNLPFVREEQQVVYYKDRKHRHKFKADFTLFDSMIVEVKSGEDGINKDVVSQTLNYLKASGCRVGLVINFGRTKMDFKRLIM